MSHRLAVFIFVLQEILSFSFSLPKGTGSVFSEQWSGIKGKEIKDLTSDPRFPNNATKREYIQNFKKKTLLENYGSRYRSYFLAKETGNYTFYTFCDDHCQVFLSSDVSPRNKRLIIDQKRDVKAPNESNCCSDYNFKDDQISLPQELEETRLYYMDVLLKQGVGFARMYVAMRTPSGEMKLPISSEYLVKHITMEYVPGDDCQIEGDSHYPDYVNCTELSDSQKVGHNLTYASQNPLTHTNS